MVVDWDSHGTGTGALGAGNWAWIWVPWLGVYILGAMAWVCGLGDGACGHGREPWLEVWV